MTDPWDGGTPPGSANPLDTVTGNIEHLQRCIRQLQTLVDDLGTPLDSKSLRVRLEKGRTHTQRVVKDTQTILKKPCDRSEKLRHEKLAAQFQTSVRHLQDVVKLSQQKEREEVLMLEESMRPGSAMDHGQRERVNSVLLLEGIDEVDAKIIQERNDDIRALEADLTELAEVFQDVAEMVGEQGDMLVQTEANVTRAEANQKAAVQELKETKTWCQRCCPCCSCCPCCGNM